MEARWLTVGPVQENTWIARQDGAEKALLIDPGRRAGADQGRAAGARRPASRRSCITHCHFDHVGAVAEMARATRAPVYCPAGEVFILEDINEYVRFPGFGPFESYSPEETVKGGDTLELAGFTIDVISTPGHSPDHVTYSIAAEKAIFSGDVLFQGSIGRTDLPGADHPTLMRSIATLLDTLPDETGVLPGHMNPTTLGQERADQPVPARARGTVKIQAPRGTYDVLPDLADERARLERDRGEDPRAAPATAGSRRRRSRPRSSSAATVGEATDVVQKEMYTFPDGSGRQPDAAAGGHRAGRALLPRARHAQGAAAGEALVPLELLPLRAPAGRPLPPVLADRRGGDRVRRPGRRRRGDPAARRAAGGDRGARREAACWRRSASRSRAPRYREELKAYLRANEDQLSARTSSSGSTSTRCAPSTPSTSRPSA